MSLVLLAAVALGQTPDRSGEAALRAVLDRMARLRKVEISLSKAARDKRADALAPTLTYMIAYDSPRVFRVDQSEYWGGGSTFSQDGRSQRIVSADGGPTRLRNAGATLMTSNPALAPGGGSFAVLFILLEGPKAFDKLVAPDGSIKLIGRRIEFKTKDFGAMTLWLSEGLVSEIVFDNKPNREASYRFLPMFSEKPEDTMEVEVIRYRFVSRFPRNTFSTATAKGEIVIDERKKPPL